MLMIVLIVIIGVSIINFKNKNLQNDIKTYELKANQTLYEGKDIPYGKYVLKSDEESLSVSINKYDGETVSSLILVSNNNEKYIEYEVKIPKDTNITVDKDSTLTNR